MRSPMTRAARRKALLCRFGSTCRKRAVEWRFVPWSTAKGGLISAYCAEHLIEADRMGAVPVTSDHLPRLRAKREEAPCE